MEATESSFEASAITVRCRDGSLRLASSVFDRLPHDSPLSLMLCGGRHGAMSSCASLDVSAAVLKVAVSYLLGCRAENLSVGFSWGDDGHSISTNTLDKPFSGLVSNVEVAELSGASALRVSDSAELADEHVAEAVTFADYICASPLRHALQRRLLQGRIRRAEEARWTGSTRQDFDATAELQAFKRTGCGFTVVKGLAPCEMSALSDMAPLMHLKILRLGSEFPRALVVAKPGVHVDLHTLAQEHAPRTARTGKHGRGGRKRGKG